MSSVDGRRSSTRLSAIVKTTESKATSEPTLKRARLEAERAVAGHAKPNVTEHKPTKRSTARINKGVQRTEVKITERKKAIKQDYHSYFEPESFELANERKGWCQIHAVNNALQTPGAIDPEAVDKYREVQAPKYPPNMYLGQKMGFWDKGLFLRYLDQEAGILLTRVRLRTNAKDPRFMELLRAELPDFSQRNMLAYLVYDAAQSSDKHKTRVEVRHAVAIVAGFVLDSDKNFHGKFFPLEDYPLREAITALYTVTRKQPKMVTTADVISSGGAKRKCRKLSSACP